MTVVRELVIFADESEQDGRYYSNFLGGVAVEGERLNALTERLEALKRDHNLSHELKWGKVSKPYLDRYRLFVDAVFDAIAAREMRLRIMFTKNTNDRRGYSQYQRENRYALLYYQFLKNAFGLPHANPAMREPLDVRFQLDEKDMQVSEWELFKYHLSELSRDRDFERAKVRLPRELIDQRKSHDYVLLQAVDVVLGAMQYKLNRKGDELNEQGRRGEKTKAKNDLYRYIYSRILALRPGYQFNTAGSTGTNPLHPEETWSHPYRHWLFKPNPRAQLLAPGDAEKPYLPRPK